MKDSIKICMICDNNYVMPTCVAIQSIINCAINNYDIYIIASALSLESEECFKKLITDKVNIQIIRENAEEKFAGMHSFEEGSICAATISALLKFLIPDIFKNFEKILYLDGDIVVKEDLAPLYDVVLEDHYLAAVMDSGSIYFSHEYVSKVQCYFNSGVMLLNLVKMRNDKLVDKLICTKKNLNDFSLMDQNVFNLVCDKCFLQLPIRYNYMPVSLERSYANWTIEQINKSYGTTYIDKNELMKDAAIIHYSSKDKPWRSNDQEMRGACFDEWVRVYKKLPTKWKIEIPKNEETGQFMVSVIMPCYNVENYVKETLDSLIKQSYKNFEIICIDDGSTDNTLHILKQYQQKYRNIQVISDTNHGQGYQRNVGLRYAVGKYIYYMDSDDILDQECFKILVEQMETNALDLLFFEGSSFFENALLEETFSQYKNMYHRNHWYPRVYNGKELFVKLRKRGEFIISPCLQMVRKKYIDDHKIRFPELKMMEDNLYTFNVLFYSNRVKCLSDVLFNRRVREKSTMTGANDKQKIEAMKYSAAQLIKLVPVTYLENEEVFGAVCQQLSSYFKVIYSSLEALPLEEKKQLLESEDHIEALLLNVSLFDRGQDRLLIETRKRLERAYNEKSEINQKLQVTYKEKSEINQKLQLTYKEKSEINRKLQITYKEKAERGLTINELNKTNKALTKRNEDLEAELNEIKNSLFYKIYKKLVAGYKKFRK